MNRWIFRSVILVLAVAAGVWIWRTFFPAPEKVIRKRMLEVAQLVSFGPNEGPLAALSKTEKLLSYFDQDVVIVVEGGRYQHRLRGRQELADAVRGSRQLPGLSVEFVDVVVKLGPDKKVGIVGVTTKARIAGEREDMIQELQFTWRRIDGRWLITRAETVKTLSGGRIGDVLSNAG